MPYFLGKRWATLDGIGGSPNRGVLERIEFDSSASAKRAPVGQWKNFHKVHEHASV
jgi:hypothetical protein